MIPTRAANLRGVVQEDVISYGSGEVVRHTTLSRLVNDAGGQSVPAYERLILPVIHHDLDPLLTATFNAQSAANIPISHGALRKALGNIALPTGWAPLMAPKLKFPQWALAYTGTGTGLPETVLTSLSVYIGLATGEAQPHKVPALHLTDLNARKLSPYSAEAAWLTLYVYDGWAKYSWKRSCDVPAQVSIRGEVLGVNLV